MKKSAFVAIIGRPSAGKSTLLNKLCGGKVAIVSAVPQTTRNAIRGIVNRPEGQLVFIDTPGRHSSEKKMNKKLMEVSQRALSDCDIVLYTLDACRAPGKEEEEIASFLSPSAGKTIAAVNKMDVSCADFSRAKEFVLQHFVPVSSNMNNETAQSTEDNAASIVPVFAVSAMTGSGLDDLTDTLFKMAPEGQPFYSEEYYTDQDAEFRIAEIIREQAINRLRQELPHSLYVDIADMELKDEKLWVRAFIIVERESQKGMVVGKGGNLIKEIRLSALKELKRIFEWKIDLDLRVKTGKDWRHNDHTLKRIIDRY